MKKEKYINITCFKAVVIIFTILLLQGCEGKLAPFPYRSLAPFSGKVIDADTKEPLSGAVVLAVYYTTIHTVAGSNSYVIDGQETLTDGKGEFYLPRKIRWFKLYRGYPEGHIVIFKPGYGKKGTAPPPNKYIVYEIPKLKTMKERKKNARMWSIDEISYEKQKLYIEKVNIERRSLGLPLIPLIPSQNIGD